MIRLKADTEGETVVDDAVQGRVVWQNKDLFPHTVTSKGSFDSDVLVNGKAWQLVTRKQGTFDYACLFHPVMKGRLIVE